MASNLIGEVSSTVKEGASTLADKTKEAAKTGVKEVKDIIVTPETEFATQAAGRKRLSRRVRSKNKWRTRRHKQSK
jgi:hypothetical protein